MSAQGLIGFLLPCSNIWRQWMARDLLPVSQAPSWVGAWLTGQKVACSKVFGFLMIYGIAMPFEENRCFILFKCKIASALTGDTMHLRIKCGLTPRGWPPGNKCLKCCKCMRSMRADERSEAAKIFLHMTTLPDPRAYPRGHIGQIVCYTTLHTTPTP